MSEQQRETDFLRHCLLYDDSAERHTLVKGIAKIERDERCVQRAVWVMTVSALLAFCGLCYSAVFQHVQNVSQLTTRLLTKSFCAVGLGSLICLVLFLVMGAAYRRQLDRHREECRRLALKLLESRLGKPQTTAATSVAANSL